MNEAHQESLVALLGATPDAPPEAVAAIQRHGLASLVEGVPLSVAEIADRSGLTAAAIREGIAGLQAAGRIEIDGEAVVGVGGLTVNPTMHSIDLPSARMHTWCALDAIGIPAAIKLKATVTTRCASCDEEIVVEVSAGIASGPDGVRLFCPTASCSDVRAEFCTVANLFCGAEHLRNWRAANPAAQGEELDLVETTALGRVMWGPRATDPKGQPDE